MHGDWQHSPTLAGATMKAAVLAMAAVVASQWPQCMADSTQGLVRELLATTHGWSSGRVEARSARQMERMRRVLEELQEVEGGDDMAQLPAATCSRVLDSCEYLAHKLGDKALAADYAMKMAATPVCQDRKQSGECFKDMASKALCRLHELRRLDEATAYFREISQLRSPSGLRLAPWQSEWQTPSFYYPDGRRLNLFPDSPGQLRGKPWWDPGLDEPASLAEVRSALETNFAEMQAEVVALLGEAGGWQLEGDHEAVQAGSWTEYILFSRSKDSEIPTWNDEHCAKVPTICRVVSSLAAVTGTVSGIGHDGQPRQLDQGPGQVTILRMAPGTQLEAHSGPQNSRLTAHLPLVVPSVDGLPVGAAGLRIGPPGRDGEFDWRVWKEGEVMIFDDSFEHESRWPEPTSEAVVGGTARYVLYSSLWHPDTGALTSPGPERRWHGAHHKAHRGRGRRNRAPAHKAKAKQQHIDDGDSGESSSGSLSATAAIRLEIERLYAKHNPSKLESVPALLTKYEGVEQELLYSIKQKYDVAEIDMDDL